MVDNLESHHIVFLFFSNVENGSKISIQAIYDVSDIFLIKYYLHEIYSLQPILKALEFLPLAFTVIIFGNHCEESNRKKIL